MGTAQVFAKRPPIAVTPWKSGPHRIACISLYRALIKICPRIEIPKDLVGKRGPVNPLTHMVRKGFRRHVYCQGQKMIVKALEVGYTVRCAVGEETFTELTDHRRRKC